MSGTKHSTKRKWFKWYHLYYFLAAFDVLTISASLYLNHTVLGIYSNSVEENSVWSNRVSQYSRMSVLAAAVNAPGNDAFDTGDIVTERRRLAEAYQVFQKMATASRDDLENNSVSETTFELIRQLEKIDEQVLLIHNKATAVFAELENNQPESAGSRMAEMDRCFSRSLGLIGTLCEEVRQIQSSRFDTETARARRLGFFEVGIAGIVGLILCAVTWYGHKMADYMRQAEDQIRKREEDLIKSNQKSEQLSAFGKILDSSLNEIYIFDAKTLHFVHVNHGAMKNIGYTMEELRGMTPLDLKPHHSQESFDELVIPLLEGTKDNIEFTTKHRRKDGTEYIVQVHLETSVLGEKQVFAAIILDVTERQQLEKELLDSRQRAKAANQSKSEFLANMSHEIRTPMTSILGFAENLLDADLPDSEKLNCVHTIRRNGEYLLSLINDILDLSKVEAGKMTVEHIECRPCSIIAEVASLMRVRADAKGLTLGIDYIGAIPETVKTDSIRLRQVLINLLGNAIKFTNVGSVRLATRFVSNCDTPYLQFDVIDTGCGITDEQKNNLFQPFTQADTSTTRKFGGTGLGLTISKRFTELLGGDLNVVATEMGLGSTFRATIAPILLDNVKMLNNPMEATYVTEDDNLVDQVSKTSLKGCRILLAEDGADNQRLISYVLKKAGADVTVEENGKLALDAALEARDDHEPFDVILMDMQMPVMDGYEATGQLRQRGYSGTIIALTAHAMASDRQKCIDAGCDAFATKPIDRVKLISTINSYTKDRDAVGAS